MFNIESSLWEIKSENPFCGEMLDDYSTISMNDFVLIIGGACQKNEDVSREVHSIRNRKNIF